MRRDLTTAGNVATAYKASAPGSLMLLGEYGVLYGKPALVSAVDKRMTVTLIPRQDQIIHLRSDRLGEYTTTLQDLTIEKPFQFVLGVLQHYQAKLRRGCDVIIESGFSHEVGLGSSAAVTVATIAALQSWLGIQVATMDIVRHGGHVVRKVQGVGSGADIAAAVYGGLVAYQQQPLAVEKINKVHDLTVYYAGYKTKTSDAIQHVKEKFIAYPQLFHFLCQSIGQCAREGIQHAREASWDKLGQLMAVQQGLMTSLGVNQPRLQAMIDELNVLPGILGAKISGSGLGDCVVGLGDVSLDYRFTIPMERISVAMSLQGVHCEKI